YTVATEAEGSDWIDLAPDGCTIFYTSQGPSVLRFDACNKNQLPPFSSSLKEGLALRALPDGGVLVANLDNIVRLDSAGRTISTYVASGEKCWASLALDSDGSSFWAADYCTSDVIRFDLTSGNQLFKFNTGTPTNTVFGLAERTAESARAPAGSLIALPSQATISSGQSASYTLSFAPVKSVAGQTISFSCGNLPRGASCSFSPQTAVAAESTVTANLTITTTAGASAWIRIAPGKLALYGLWLPLALVLLPSEAAMKKRASLLAALILMAILLACSGATTNSSSSPPPTPAAPVAGTTTPAGGYTILIHARAGAMDSSTAVQLTVQ
ncbi:MAG TPA: hypothetical protein VJP04_16585, partial [Terriglobales bacterium]|nr:hypothetical protein [Terriglobales bacterium]